jgi:hypothetical protein
LTNLQPTPALASLFPALTRFIEESGLADKAKGNLAAKIPRILGQGMTKAVGLVQPPADIERKMEVASLELPSGIVLPPAAQQEIHAAVAELAQLKAELSREEGKRRLATAALAKIPQPGGIKDGKFYAGRLILGAERAGLEWKWSVTPHYPIIRRIPPDSDYIARAFDQAQIDIQKLTLPADVFERQLLLSWSMARHFSTTDDVLVTDVMRMFKVAGQDEKFWQAPQRQFFKNLPEAAFVVNLMNWRTRSSSHVSAFEFVPATVDKALKSNAQVFFMPMNNEGTDVRPMVYLRKRQ